MAASNIRRVPEYAPDAEVTLSFLMVRCPATGREFNSGYRTNGGDLAAVPPSYTIRIRCTLCNKTHAIKLSEARVAPEPSKK